MIPRLLGPYIAHVDKGNEDDCPLLMEDILANDSKQVKGFTCDDVAEIPKNFQWSNIIITGIFMNLTIHIVNLANLVTFPISC